MQSHRPARTHTHRRRKGDECKNPENGFGRGHRLNSFDQIVIAAQSLNHQSPITNYSILIRSDRFLDHQVHTGRASDEQADNQAPWRRVMVSVPPHADDDAQTDSRSDLKALR
jgi:hypothetical protein